MMTSSKQYGTYDMMMSGDLEEAMENDLSVCDLFFSLLSLFEKNVENHERFGVEEIFHLEMWKPCQHPVARPGFI